MRRKAGSRRRITSIIVKCSLVNITSSHSVHTSVSSLSAILLLCILLIACKQKERTPEAVPNLSQPSILPLSSESFLDAPLVYHSDDGTTIHHLKQASDYSLTAHTDTSLSHTPTISVYANNLFQYEVDIRNMHTPPATVLSGLDTVLVSSDIEGNYEAFVSLLQGNGVIDSDKNWMYNDNHLVLIGDMLDRGDEVLQVLWLIYKLEAEAENHGGGVHYLLGNHEQMNLRSNHKAQNTSYVHLDYMRYASALGIPYQDWFSSNAELGRWLRSKNTILAIDRILFVHGGIGSRTAGLQLSLEEINETIRATMDTNSADMDRVAALLHSAEGPMWYRGVADQEMPNKKVNKVLRVTDMDRMVIGHTLVDFHDIKPLYDDTVIPIDMHHSETFKEGVISALLINTEGFYQVDNHGRPKLLFLHHPIKL